MKRPTSYYDTSATSWPSLGGTGCRLMLIIDAARIQDQLAAACINGDFTMPGTCIVHVRVLGFGLCAHLMIIVVLKKQRCWLMPALVKTCRDLFSCKGLRLCCSRMHVPSIYLSFYTFLPCLHI